MTNEEAVLVLKDFFCSVVNLGQRSGKMALREAFSMAIAALEREGTDGCENCDYSDRTEFESPCNKCKNNFRNYWRSSHERINRFLATNDGDNGFV